MKNILLLTPIYPGPGVSGSATPVVHYFTKEWVKLGYNVKVVNYPSNFPTPILWFAKIFHSILESLLNVSIRVNKLDKLEYELDGVDVMRFPLSKFKPHSRYKKRQLESAVLNTIEWCNIQKFVPDVIIGHWINPQVEIMIKLKEHYNVPISLVMHDAGNDFNTIYKKEKNIFLSKIDIIGYRSDAIKRKFERSFGVNKKWFYCYSGVPEDFCNYKNLKKTFVSINKIIFIGMLIERKYPIAILESLMKSEIKDFNLSYIGNGDQVSKIKKILKKNPQITEKVKFIGRVPRDDVKKYLSESDVFVMISRHETFGLVYLEAMAAGCITIASRDEGFDGIIKNGYNGFLCEAGNVDELTLILNKINKLTKEERLIISNNARATALQMTDVLVAKKYIEDVKSLN